MAERKLPCHGKSRSLHVLEWHGAGRRAHFPAGKQCPLPGKTVRSGRADQPGPQAAAEGAGGRRRRRLETTLLKDFERARLLATASQAKLWALRLLKNSILGGAALQALR